MSDPRKCAQCNSDAHVIDCRKTKNGFRRRRQCDSCGARWTSLEVLVDCTQGKFVDLKPSKKKKLYNISQALSRLAEELEEQAPHEDD